MQRYLILLTLVMAGSSYLHAAEVMPASSPQPGDYISLMTGFGTTFNAYVVGDENAEKGVILIHDQWGLDKHVRQWADRFAELGYRALAVDLYDSRQVSDAGMAEEVWKSIDPLWFDANLKGALSYLKKSQRKIVSMGWGAGAEHALLLALQEPQDVSAVVAYYGVPAVDDQFLNSLNGPMLSIFASRDARIENARRSAFRLSMAALGKELVEVVLDADRGFANPRTKAYNEATALAAWDKTQEFLSRYLAAPAKTN